MTSIKILQLNTQSFNTSKQYLPFLQETHNADVICLQETWLTDENITYKDWKTRNRTITPSKQAGYGVATPSHPSIKTIQRKDLDNPNLECTLL